MDRHRVAVELAKLARELVRTARMTDAAAAFIDIIEESWDRLDPWEMTVEEGYLADPDEEVLRELCEESGESYKRAEREVMEYIKDHVEDAKRRRRGARRPTAADGDVKKPKSVYDASGIFGWASPADNYAPPWRVAHADVALDYIKKLTGEPDVYVEHDSERGGRMVLWVGLRDNRDKDAHEARLDEVERLLKVKRFKVKRGRGFIRLLDDLKRNVLSAAARGSGTVVRVWWDTADPDNAGWYAVVEEDGDVVDDSMKVWFPVDMDKYGEGDARRLERALEREFPDAEIEMED